MAKIYKVGKMMFSGRPSLKVEHIVKQMRLNESKWRPVNKWQVVATDRMDDPNVIYGRSRVRDFSTKTLAMKFVNQVKQRWKK